MKKLFIAAVLSLMILVGSPLDARASDWPMFQADAGRSGRNSTTAIRPPLELSWVKGPQKSYLEKRTRPVAAGGLVYIGQRWSTYFFAQKVKDYGQLQAVSLTDGKPAWTVTDMFVAGTPALANGMIYAGTDDGLMHALGAADGMPRWSVDVGGKPNSPAVYGHRLYVTTASGRLCVLDASTGAIIWSIERSRLLYAPAVLDGLVVVGGSELAAFNTTDGSIKWSFNSGATAYSTPTLSDDAVFVSCPYTIYRLDRADGRVAWSRFTGDKYGALKASSLDEETLYWGAVTAIDAESGETRWKFDSQNDLVGTSVAVTNGLVFVGASHHHDMTIDHSDGRLYVLKSSTGELLWEYKAGIRYGDWYGIDPSPAIAGKSVILNLSTKQLACFTEGESAPLPFPVTLSKDSINPYDSETGQVDISFELDAPAVVTVGVLDYSGRPVRGLLDAAQLDGGGHVYTWHGLIDFPEMADPDLALNHGDKGICVAPDGEYRLFVFLRTADGLEYRGEALVNVKADV